MLSITSTACTLQCLLQAVTEEFFVLATRQVHSRRLDALEASMQRSLHVMRLSEAELVELYGLPTAHGTMQVRCVGVPASPCGLD